MNHHVFEPLPVMNNSICLCYSKIVRRLNMCTFSSTSIQATAYIQLASLLSIGYPSPVIQLHIEGGTVMKQATKIKSKRLFVMILIKTLGIFIWDHLVSVSYYKQPFHKFLKVHTTTKMGRTGFALFCKNYIHYKDIKFITTDEIQINLKIHQFIPLQVNVKKTTNC